jgi:hypothetical protein
MVPPFQLIVPLPSLKLGASSIFRFSFENSNTVDSKQKQHF